MAVTTVCIACKHVRAYHTGGKVCRLSGCTCQEFVENPPDDYGQPSPPLNIPALAWPVDEQALITVGIPEFLFDGLPFPWATTDDWHLTFRDDGMATLTVCIPVRLVAAVPKEEPAAEDAA